MILLAATQCSIKYVNANKMRPLSVRRVRGHCSQGAIAHNGPLVLSSEHECVFITFWLLCGLHDDCISFNFDFATHSSQEILGFTAWNKESERGGKRKIEIHSFFTFRKLLKWNVIYNLAVSKWSSCAWQTYENRCLIRINLLACHRLRIRSIIRGIPHETR